MKRTAIVAQSEFLRLIRTKAFIIGILLMPVLFGVLILFMKYAEGHVDLDDRRFAVIDQTGVLYQPLASAVEVFNKKSGEGPTRTGPHFLPVPIDATGHDLETVKLELSERVRRKELFAFVLIPKEALAGRPDKAGALQYYTETIAYEKLPDWLEKTLGDQIAKRRFAAAGINETLADQLTARTSLSTFGLIERRADGTVSEAQEIDTIAMIGPPIFLMVLMFVSVMTSAQHLLNAIIEEKMSRISEVLLGSVTPFQLLMGKLVGVSGVSVLLALVYFGGAVFAVFETGRWDLLHPGLMAWFILFLICAALMYGAIFLALGSACSSISDAQSLLQPAMMLLMLAYIGSIVAMRAPDSALALGMSFFPTTAPFTMMLRMAVPPGAPWWQVLLSLLTLFASTAGVVWAASRIFRIGILMQGKAPNLPELLRWIRAEQTQALQT